MKIKMVVILGKRSHSLYFRGFSIGYEWRRNVLTLPYTKKFDVVISYLIKLLNFFYDVRVIVLMPNYSCELPLGVKVLVINHESGHLHNPPTEGVNKPLLDKIYKCINSADCIVYPTNQTRKEHLYFEPEFKDKKWLVLHHQFDQTKIEKCHVNVCEKDIDILSIGTIQKRKNWSGFFELVQLLHAPKVIHVIVPEKFQTMYAQQIAQVIKQGHKIVIHNGITEERKNYLLKKSKYYVQVSTYEGFCVPIFEALYSDCNVLAMRTGIMSEAHSKFDIFYESYDEIAAHINLDKSTVISQESIYDTYCDIAGYKSSLIHTVSEL